MAAANLQARTSLNMVTLLDKVFAIRCPLALLLTDLCLLVYYQLEEGIITSPLLFYIT